MKLVQDETTTRKYRRNKKKKYCKIVVTLVRQKIIIKVLATTARRVTSRHAVVSRTNCNRQKSRGHPRRQLIIILTCISSPIFFAAALSIRIKCTACIYAIDFSALPRPGKRRGGFSRTTKNSAHTLSRK